MDKVNIDNEKWKREVEAYIAAEAKGHCCKLEYQILRLNMKYEFLVRRMKLIVSRLEDLEDEKTLTSIEATIAKANEEK